LPLAPELPSDTAVLSLDIRGGYAWYFPKGDHANVGAGTHRGTARDALKEALVRFARSVGLAAAEGKIAGHWIPQGLRRGPLASPRVLLAGDAAATADPLFGEGIAYAIVSGIAAAQAIGDWEAGRLGDLRAYDGRLRELLGPAFRRLEVAALAAEPSMTLAMGAIRLSRWVRGTAVDAIAGRRLPFALDARCDLACACGIDHERLTAEDCSGPCPHRARDALDPGGCHAGSDAGTVIQRPCRSASLGSQRGALQWSA
jgi:flavin-dependent dehydrogenase